jgi:dihydrofolate reductase
MSRSELVIIAAIAQNGIIGATRDGQPVMPWHLPEDMRHFKALTMGHPILMGRKTWQSLGRPLPGRRNIVISRNPDFHADGAQTCTSLEAAVALCANETAFIIGGGELYAQALPQATRLELTELAIDAEGDTVFPAWPRDQFVETARDTHHAAAGFDFAFVSYQRRAE